jgi:hypothetical protein
MPDCHGSLAGGKVGEWVFWLAYRRVGEQAKFTTGGAMRTQIASAFVVGLIATSAIAGEDHSARNALVGDAPSNQSTSVPTAPYPGYIEYSKEATALPASNCYWTRMPIYDSSNGVIGWRGRPVAVCPRRDASMGPR